MKYNKMGQKKEFTKNKNGIKENIKRKIYPPNILY